MGMAHVGDEAVYVGFYKLPVQLLYMSKTTIWGPNEVLKASLALIIGNYSVGWD